MENDKMSKKEEVGGGLLVASCLIFLILIVLIIYSPVIYYLEKWNNLWNKEESLSRSLSDFEVSDYTKNFIKATDECKKIVSNYYNSTVVASYASSTSSEYETYDCYGTKYTKIKEIK